MRATRTTTLVLGAGPTGLGAAWHLDAMGETDWLLVDAADRPGGTAVTTLDAQGFRWDLGGHVIHSHFDYFDDVVSRFTDWTRPRRGGWVRLDGGWCPTPIQQHLGNLPQGPRIVVELGAVTPRREPADLGEYYAQTFGPTLSGLFFEPFNVKQWAWPLDELDHSWTSLRAGSVAANVPRPATSLVVGDEPSDTSRFPYPRLGTGSLWQHVSSSLPRQNQEYGRTVVRIDLHGRRVRLEDGGTIAYEHLISTLPLNVLLRLVSDSRPDLAVLAPALKHSSTHAVGLGFEGEVPDVLADKTWVFSADPEVPFHRLSVPSNFSQDMAGPGRWSVMLETATSVHRPVATGTLVDRHLAELRRWGVTGEPVSVWTTFLALGYPLPFLGRDALLARILPDLEAVGVRSRGRFGAWRYESSNQDYAFMQGVEAVDANLTGAREVVFAPAVPDPGASTAPTT